MALPGPAASIPARVKTPRGGLGRRDGMAPAPPPPSPVSRSPEKANAGGAPVNLGLNSPGKWPI